MRLNAHIADKSFELEERYISYFLVQIVSSFFEWFSSNKQTLQVRQKNEHYNKKMHLRNFFFAVALTIYSIAQLSAVSNKRTNTKF